MIDRSKLNGLSAPNFDAVQTTVELSPHTPTVLLGESKRMMTDIKPDDFKIYVYSIRIISKMINIIIIIINDENDEQKSSRQQRRWASFTVNH